MAGKKGRKVVFVEMNGKKGSKTFLGKSEQATLCRRCSKVNDCGILKTLKVVTVVEMAVYGCEHFEPIPESAPVKTEE